eukprot:TRINITY_DN1586_c0_g1_i1.p1 TRINITY_DN1586_c0_g1~~TRINITY_DN1586_c0_g1_i1.p1  ORF type:complete len:71 (-),score=10.35 TRINITY_DN1586_c0_g1_i1:185-397(-)
MTVMGQGNKAVNSPHSPRKSMVFSKRKNKRSPAFDFGSPKPHSTAHKGREAYLQRKFQISRRRLSNRRRA